MPGSTVVKAARAELVRGLFQTEIGALKAVDPIFTGEGRGELHIVQMIAETGEIPFRGSYELHAQTIFQVVVSFAAPSAAGTGPGQKGMFIAEPGDNLQGMPALGGVRAPGSFREGDVRK